MEIAFAVGGGFGKFFNDAGGGVDGGPADAGVVGNREATENEFCVLQDGREEIGLGVAVSAGEVGGADGKAHVILVGEAVEIFEEADGVVGGKALGVFGEGLRDDAEGFDGVAAGFKDGFRVAEELGGFGELQLVL